MAAVTLAVLQPVMTHVSITPNQGCHHSAPPKSLLLWTAVCIHQQQLLATVPATRVVAVGALVAGMVPKNHKLLFRSPAVWWGALTGIVVSIIAGGVFAAVYYLASSRLFQVRSSSSW